MVTTQKTHADNGSSKSINHDGSSSSSSSSSSGNKTALTRVERAKSGTGHCFFCDTIIAKDSPRVVWHLYHSAGSYSRNNGAATGYTAGGWLDMYAHPQCCFHYHILEDTTPTTGNNKKKIHLSCSVCETKITDGRRVLTCTAAGGKRCRRNLHRPPLVHCFGCAGQFLMTHRELLQTVVSSSQRRVGVAWAPPKSIFDKHKQDETWHLPRDSKIRREYLALFDLSSSESGGGDCDNDNDNDAQLDGANSSTSSSAVEQQMHLQKVIREALETDRKRQRSK